MRNRVHGVGPDNAKIMVVGMAPAKWEFIKGKPFVGPSGDMLNRAFAINGINRNDCFITNVLEWQIPFGATIFGHQSNIVKTGYATQQEVDDEVIRLKQEIETIKPNVIFALGNDPLYCLTGRNGVINYRGSILPCKFGNSKVVVSLHPSGIMQGLWKYEKIFQYVDTARLKEESLTSSYNTPTRNAIIHPSFTQTIEYLQECEQHEWVSFDIETMWWSSTKMGEISCISFSFKEDEAISIPFIYGGGQPYWGESQEVIVWQAIAQVLQNKQVKKIGQNVSFDTFYMWHHKIYPYPIAIDTMLLHHCLYPDFGGVEDVTYEGMKRKKTFLNPGHTLRLLTSLYTRTPYYKAVGREWIPAMGDDRFWIYNAMDSMVDYEIAMKMMVEAQEDELWDFFNEHYMAHFYHALRMEWFGIAIDLDKRQQGRQHVVERAKELQININHTLGYELNVASPKQLQDLMYNKRGYQAKKKRGTQRVTADKTVLEYYATKRNDPVLKDILELKKCLDEISDVYDVQLTPEGRMQCHYKIGGAGGSRWSSTASITGSGTNLQNVRRDGIARELYLPT